MVSSHEVMYSSSSIQISGMVSIAIVVKSPVHDIDPRSRGGNLYERTRLRNPG
jgi:hypothetical protein